MKSTVPPIPLENLILALLPVLVVIIIVHRWGLGVWTPLYATARMLVQLVAVGYVLKYLFLTDSPLVVLATLAVMLFAASWISLRPLQRKSVQQYLWALIAIACGGGGVVLLMTQGVLHLETWYDPRRVIPLAGMSLTAAMNCVSLAGERFEAETDRGATYHEARRQAMQASLITVTNSLLAVGLVSLPGLMTGQILAGISPLIASRYQIMIMCMVFSAGGIAAAIYLSLSKQQVMSKPDES